MRLWRLMNEEVQQLCSFRHKSPALYQVKMYGQLGSCVEIKSVVVVAQFVFCLYAAA
jgi:hypothetical protein